MGKLIYTAIASLDGFIEDSNGGFDWAEPRQDLHTFINRLEAQNRVLIYGRRIYETMLVWESEEQFKDLPVYVQDYGRAWRAAEKIVYSRTITEARSSKTTIRTLFDASEIRTLKKATAGNIGIGGAELASLALSQGLVDEVNLFLHPIVIGGGKSAIATKLPLKLSLLETQVFEGGVVLLHYGVPLSQQ